MKKIKNLLIIIFALTTLIISFFIDKQINFLFGNLNNTFLDFMLSIITNFSFLLIVLYIIPTIFLIKNKKTNQFFYLWLTFFASFIVSFILKVMVARPRPLNNTFIGFLSYSFPSMHTLTAFAALPLLDNKFPKLRIFWILVVFFIAVSRIYFNFHFLSDVVAGAIIGYGIGLLLVNLEQKFNIYNKVYKK